MVSNSQKSWLSPFVAVTCFAVALTGILLLFHLKFPGVYPIHKWGGLIFIIGGLIHLLLNWRLFVSYFKKSKAVWGAVIGALAMLLIAVAVPSKSPKGIYHQNAANSSLSYDSSQRTQR